MEPKQESLASGKTTKKSVPKATTKSKQTNKPTFKLSRWLVWGTTFALTATVSATVGATFALVSPLSTFVAPIAEKTGLLPEKAKGDEGWQANLQYRLSRPVHILVMGIDQVPGAAKTSKEIFEGHSDTMLLLRFDPGDNSVKMLSIPRDTRVNIPGLGEGKINDANIQGGAELAAKVVSETLNGVSIDRYLRVNTDAFQEIVDLVGGIEVDVPYSMAYEDKSQKLKIDLQAGWQTLNGEEAEQFARFRGDGYGDIGRVQRQQILLKALRQRLKQPAIVPKLPKAIRVVQQYVDTNISTEEMLALVSFGLNLNKEDINMVMLPGRFSSEGEYDVSYWIFYPNERDRLVSQYFNQEADYVNEKTKSFRQLRIGIQNTTRDPELAERFAEYLRENDFGNVFVIEDVAPRRLKDTTIIPQRGDLRAANRLKKVLNLGTVKSESTGHIDSDLTIQLGRDAQQILVEEDLPSEVKED
ncbi:MAG: LCP family protein [Spirulinaceae cyanobacterium]